jgi:LysM repeat protein
MQSKGYKYKLLIIIGLIFTSYPVLAQNSVKSYINKYKDLAIKEMKRTGIPASITLAQGILESDAGNSRLATKANNHFGVKCHSSWKGKKIYHDDDAKNECFRKYKSVYDSFKDHSEFIKNGQRYQFLFDYKITDYKSWAKGLKKAGYATDRSYAQNLIRIIETYNLHHYDSKKYKKENKKQEKKKKKERREEKVNYDDFTINPFQGEIKQNNDIDYVVVKKGQTVFSIAKKFDMMQWQLIKYNELDENATISEGQYLYLQPKKKKADIYHKTHIVKEAESMYQISQLYGIKLKSLYEKNHMKFGSEANPGDILNLRKKKKN